MSKDILTYLMGFIYPLAHYLGLLIVNGIKTIFPFVKGINALIDPIGFLAILTIFLILFTIARKIVWFIVIVGWILIFIRIGLMIMGIGEIKEKPVKGKPSQKAVIFYESYNLLS